MKSENALEYLHSTSDEKEFLEMTDLLPLHDAIKAVEIAESERDAKAAEALCNTVCGGLNLDCEKCTLRPAFIQKLNEE